MQRIGISSACRYPLLLEDSLDFLGRNGAETIEIFVNTISEMEDDYVKKMIDICQRYSMNVVSVHPFSSFAETFCLFSAYPRRFYDFLKFYERFFTIAKKLGAKYFIFHGEKRVDTITDEEYIKRYRELLLTAKNCGIMLLHENVVGHIGQDPDFFVRMRDEIGDDFKIVLDTKQAFRSNRSPYEYLDKMFDSIEHIHISDRNDKIDCLPPFKGEFDIDKFISTCEKSGYNGCYIQEVYKWSYNDPVELFVADKELKKCLKKNSTR